MELSFRAVKVSHLLPEYMGGQTHSQFFPTNPLFWQAGATHLLSAMYLAVDNVKEYSIRTVFI